MSFDPAGWIPVRDFEPPIRDEMVELMKPHFKQPAVIAWGMWGDRDHEELYWRPRPNTYTAALVEQNHIRTMPRHQD